MNRPDLNEPDPARSRSGYRGVIVQPGFRLYLCSRVVVWTGTSVSTVALPLLLYQRTGSAALTGLATALEALPYLLFGLPAGALADRWDRRRTMQVTSWVSAAAIATVPLAQALGILTTAHVLATATVVSTSFVFNDAAAFGLLPRLVGRAHITSATSTLVSVSTVIGLGGPATGGVLAATLGPANALGADALGYAVAAALLGTLPWRREPPPAPAPLRAQLRQVRDDVLEGLAYIWQARLVRTLTLLGTGLSATNGAVLGLVVVAAVRHLGLAVDDSRIGLLYAAAALGTLVSALLLPRLADRVGVGAVTLVGLALTTLAVTGWALTTSLVMGLLILIVWQGAASLTIVNGIVVRQTVTPDRLQSRVNTTARMVAWGGQPAGAALGGVVADALDLRAALLLAATGSGVALLGGLAAGLARTPPLAHLAVAEPPVPRSR